MKPTTLARIDVWPRPNLAWEGRRRQGLLVAGALRMPCALGRSGPVCAKREGDGASPVGSFALVQAFWRPDRIRRPLTRLPLFPIRPKDGWCDAAEDRNYNRPVALPYPASVERMWREDGLYDLVVDIAWNRGPIRKGRGSAIFLHLAREGFRPTEGCVALRRSDASKLLARLGPHTRIVIHR